MVFSLSHLHLIISTPPKFILHHQTVIYHQHFITPSYTYNMTLTYHNGVSIGEIIVYVPALFIAILAEVKHCEYLISAKIAE